MPGTFDPETGFADEYDQQVGKRFRESSLPHFVEDLRNYALRNELLFALSELSFGVAKDRLEVDCAIRLDASELRNWEEWSEKEREYLDVLDNKVKLEDIVDEYTSLCRC